MSVKICCLQNTQINYFLGGPVPATMADRLEQRQILPLTRCYTRQAWDDLSDCHAKLA